jgi:hypothetical protein
MGLSRYLTLGALAGAAGTLAMDLLLYSRYRRGGGTDSLWQWEFAADVTNWEQASAPGKVGEKMERFVTGQQPPDAWARPTTNLVHWATGISWGVQYGLLACKTSDVPWLRALALGPVAWLSSYVILPLLGVYKPIWDYDTRTLRDDLSAHVVFGTATSAVFAALRGTIQ